MFIFTIMKGNNTVKTRFICTHITFVHSKSLDPIHLTFYGHDENNRFDLFVYTKNLYGSFSNHTHIKLIKKLKKTCL